MKHESDKIELIKMGAVAAVCKYGIAGASVSRIASMAGVSDGYLYRHYKSKEELLYAILDNTLNVVTDKIADLLGNCSDAREIADYFLDFLYENSEKDSNMIKFLIIFQNDFTIEVKREFNDRITHLCKEIVALGCSKGVMRSGVSHVELYLALVTVPLQFLSLKYTGLLYANEIEYQKIKDYAYNSLFLI